ncbi:hypothetical protein PGTUg99_022567 [Puccinia graminis f. sp. tritici]|uniref:Uncharacterized protein n=1 Tax=Puccinia graminis f. sp. tritici TaxID=56615 RepID=A0A5B0QSI6_PUCGR|nr:hypothetical protein PGTUg99_022567 [Puccinia graminis f. sp. tritici]
MRTWASGQSMRTHRRGTTSTKKVASHAWSSAARKRVFPMKYGTNGTAWDASGHVDFKTHNVFDLDA